MDLNLSVGLSAICTFVFAFCHLLIEYLISLIRLQMNLKINIKIVYKAIDRDFWSGEQTKRKGNSNSSGYWNRMTCPPLLGLTLVPQSKWPQIQDW